jgi:tRNA A-37 threonylcarbamoyl transferase component Bud32
LFAAGQSIGSYRILQKIGTGGMGAVYLAEHPLIGKKVALKVIHRELASNKEVVQRFFQEAKAVTRIGNEHIVEIHDFGQTQDGDHFYIMEYLEGQTLAGVLANERVLDVMRALHIGAQIAAALAAAHAAGVIHRDLKPDNVMLTMRLGDPNFVVLLDFGLAKMFVGGGQSAVKTAAGVLLGTPQYMSPEACESKGNLDHRTDIYALGILLFQMMTGMLPFDGETMGEVLVKQVTQLPPPPRGFNASIPPSVEQIVLRCLAKNVDARFPTMMALREALLDPEAYLRNSPPIAPARSLAPGEAKVDAKTVMAYAAQQQRAQQQAPAEQQRTRIGIASGPNAALPLPAPAPSLSGNADARTMIAKAGVAPMQQPQAPEMVAPAQPKMNTMRISTPLGYSSRPPRKMWPIVLVLALLLGLGGGAFAVAWFGKHDGAGAAATDAAAVAVKVDAPAPKPAPPPPRPDAAVTAPPKPDAVAPNPSMAAVVIDSTPQGAEVFGADKTFHGKTPVTLSLPISDMPVELELRLAGYKKKSKQVVVTGNTVLNVMLDRAPASSGGTRKGSGHKKGSGDDLMRPDDL